MGSQHTDAQATPADATTGIPSPTTGAAAGDLVTTSDDPAILRELLDRARERLAFYQSFDRIIGENIRRSGELMVETVALREEAKAQAVAFAAERAAFEASRQADREAYRTLVQNALNDVAATRPVIDGLVERLQAALVGFGEEPTAEDAPAEAVSEAPEAPAEEIEAAPEAETVEASATEAEAVQPDEVASEPQTPAPVNASEPPVEEDAAASAVPASGPRTVEILAHGVQTAAIAIALQRTLRELEKVSNVEAREFANGVLRLQTVVDGAIERADLAPWLEAHEGRITSATPTVLEIALGAVDLA